MQHIISTERQRERVREGGIYEERGSDERGRVGDI